VADRITPPSLLPASTGWWTIGPERIGGGDDSARTGTYSSVPTSTPRSASGSRTGISSTT
jgi:hypothetical protein